MLCGILFGSCFSFPLGRLSGFSGHPYRMFWVVSGTGFGTLVCAACFAGPALLSKVCRSLSLASVFSAMRFFGFLICHPLSVAHFGVGLSGSVFWSDLAWFFFCHCMLTVLFLGFGFLPRLFPGLSGFVGFRFVGPALKVSFSATPNKFCLS